MLPGVTMFDKDDDNYVDSCVTQDTLATVIVDHAATAFQEFITLVFLNS